MYRLAVCCILALVHSIQSSSPTGTVELNELSFNKIINKFHATLVKFDVAFPYGEKHDAFVEIAKDAMDVEELLVAEVGVKDYGEKENEKLAFKYGATKENFPVVKLLIRGKPDPITFNDQNGFTTDELRKFVIENTGLYLNLPGCVRELDLLAKEFMKGNEEEKQNILKKAVQFKGKNVPKIGLDQKAYYIAVMEKILNKGDSFPEAEIQRLNKLLNNKISEENKQKFIYKTNILQAFQNKLDKINNDEL